MDSNKPEFLILHEQGQKLLHDGKALPEGSPEREAILNQAFDLAKQAVYKCPPDEAVWPAFLCRSALYVGEWAEAPSHELAALAKRGLELDPEPMIRDDLYEALAQDDPEWLLERLRSMEGQFDYESGCFLSTEPKGPEQAMGDLSDLLAMIDALLEDGEGLPDEERAELVEDAAGYRNIRAFHTQHQLYVLQTSSGLDEGQTDMYVDLIFDDLEQAEERAADINSNTKEDSSLLATINLIHFFTSFIYGKNDTAKEILRKLFAASDDMKPYARNELRLLSHAFGKHTRKLLDQKKPEVHSPAIYAQNCRLLMSAIARIRHERKSSFIHVHPKRESIYDAIERIYTEHDIDIASADIAIKFFGRLISELIIKSSIKNGQTKPYESLRESPSNILAGSKGHSVRKQTDEVHAARLKSSYEDFSPKRSSHEGHAKTVIIKITNKQKEIYYLSENDGLSTREIARRLHVSSKYVIASINKVKRGLKQNAHRRELSKSNHLNRRDAYKTVRQTKSSSLKSK